MTEETKTRRPRQKITVDVVTKVVETMKTLPREKSNPGGLEEVLGYNSSIVYRIFLKMMAEGKVRREKSGRKYIYLLND